MTVTERRRLPLEKRPRTLRTGGVLLGLIALLAMIASCSQAGDELTTETSTATTSPALATPVPPTATSPSTITTQDLPVSPTLTAAVTPEETVDAAGVPDLAYLAQAFDRSLVAFEGGVASYYVGDLRSGQVAVHNGDLAISGMSIVKIPILLETYRRLDEPPSPAQMRLITETATLSGNYTANLLLEQIAGQPDPFAGAQQVTESMRGLGLYNTFIAVPYDLEPDPRYLPTYSTPANQQTDVSTNPDSSMQTTVSDMGRLLTMLYECAGGSGYLLDTYAGELTDEECRQIIDVMSANDIDAFIEEGVPVDVPVAHKHGWVGETHADAAIVRLEERPYVLVVALHRPGWLEWADSTVLIAELSQMAYAHFAGPPPYSPEQLAQPAPTLQPAASTPDLPRAYVRDTGGAGVVLRQSPGGAEIAIVPEGSLVFLLQDSPEQQAEGLVWRHVRLLGELSGWLATEFLEVP